MIGCVVTYCGLVLVAAGVVLVVRPIRRLGVTTRSRGLVVAGAGVLVAGVGLILPVSESRVTRVETRQSFAGCGCGLSSDARPIHHCLDGRANRVTTGMVGQPNSAMNLTVGHWYHHPAA